MCSAEALFGKIFGHLKLCKYTYGIDQHIFFSVHIKCCKMFMHALHGIFELLSSASFEVRVSANKEKKLLSLNSKPCTCLLQIFAVSWSQYKESDNMFHLKMYHFHYNCHIYIYPILNHLTVSVSSRVIGLIMHDIYVVSISFFQDYHYNHFNWNMVCPVSVCFWHVLSFAMYAQTSMWWPCATSDQTSQCWLPILPCYR